MIGGEGGHNHFGYRHASICLLRQWLLKKRILCPHLLHVWLVGHALLLEDRLLLLREKGSAGHAKSCSSTNFTLTTTELQTNLADASANSFVNLRSNVWVVDQNTKPISGQGRHEIDT
jgi:hypothetical protein